MEMKDRLKLGLSVVIKKNPYAAGIFSVITGRDCSSEHAFDISQNTEIFPFISTCLPMIEPTHTNKTLAPFLEYLRVKTNGRTMLIICGPSGTGKDSIASLTKGNLYDKHDATEYCYCKKFTTRNRRANEGIDEYSRKMEPSGNYEYFETLEAMRRHHIDLEYSLYDCYYALDASELASQAANTKHLACIYGALENIATAKRTLFEKYGRIPFSVLIKAPAASLRHRINGRHSMSKTEKADRLEAMERQASFIETQGEAFEANFDLVITNGNDDRLLQNAIAMTNFVHNSLAWVNRNL